MGKYVFRQLGEEKKDEASSKMLVMWPPLVDAFVYINLNLVLSDYV